MTKARPILIVEDDLDVRDALKDNLEEAGYEVTCAGNGEEALRYLQDGGRPALILLDVMMPGMNGFQFRAEQLSTPDLADIPVVVLTANQAISKQYREVGACDLITKPVSLETLLATVDRHVTANA